MAGISSLPDELLALIFSKLDCKKVPSDLLALRLVDQRCARLATNLVYLSIPGSSPKPSGPVAYDSHPNLRRWAHRIVQSPKGSSMIKEVVYGRASPLPAGITTSCEIEDGLSVVLHKVGLELEAYLARLSDSDPQIPLLLILALSPNLERFHTMRGLSGIAVEAFFHQVAQKHIEAAGGGGPPCDILSHVKSIEIGLYHHDTDVRQTLLLLTLPSLELLEIHGLKDQDQSTYLPLPAPDGLLRNNNPRLRLHFDSCELSESGLALILQACKSPSALTVRWIIGKYVNGGRELHMEQIAAVLRQHGTQIKEVVLDYTNPWLARVARVQYEQRSLGNMAKSKHTVLGVPYSNFANMLQHTAVLDQAAAVASMLPCNLRKLYVLGIEHEQQTPFNGLQARMPVLESVVCVPWVGYQDGRYQSTCVDYRAARELELPMVCEQEGYELLQPLPHDAEVRTSRSHGRTVSDYYDMIA